MIQWLKRRFGRGGPTHPRVTVGLYGEKVLVDVDWPEPKTDEEAAELSERLALFLGLLNKGRFINLFRGSLGMAAKQHGYSYVAEHASEVLAALQDDGMDELAVRPTSVFDVRTAVNYNDD